MTVTDKLTPVADHSRFWQNAHSYFDRVYQTMDLDHSGAPCSPRPKRMMTVSCPVKMDDGQIQVFTGYRAQHNNARRAVQRRHSLRRLGQSR